jgi:hypothetical protein
MTSPNPFVASDRAKRRPMLAPLFPVTDNQSLWSLRGRAGVVVEEGVTTTPSQIRVKRRGSSPQKLPRL